MNTDDIRLNARLTGDDARRFFELQRDGNRSASDLLRDALREYYDAHSKRRPNALTLMKASGFIGTGDGSADLSTNYKTYLTESLSGKFPQRVNESRATYKVRRKK
jgi:Ribbon-helix-helix protein, copG family